MVVLEQLRQLRNRIRHFAVQTDQPSAVSLITKAYSFAIDFITREIEPHRHDQIEYELDDLRLMLGQFEEFVRARLTEIQTTLRQQRFSVHVACPACLQQTLYADGGTASCAFCGFNGEGEAAASAWADRFRWQTARNSLIDPVVVDCPECGLTALVPAAEMRVDNVRHVCLGCGQSGFYEDCPSCGQLHGSDNPGEMCDGCWEAFLERNP